MPAVRTVFAVGVPAAAVWCLRSGVPFGAVAVVALAIGLRRAAETGGLERLSRRLVGH